jgi:general stress protein YciG
MKKLTPKEAGRLGGLKSRGGGFSGNSEFAKIQGSKGGKLGKPSPRMHTMYEGKKYTIMELSKFLGVNYNTLLKRLHRENKIIR